MADKKYTKESELNRLLKILNKSEDHKSLFNRLKKERKQIKTGDFTTDYLGKGEDELESYMRALDEIVTDYMYDSNLKKYVILLSPSAASFDQYINFEDRGNKFKEIVNQQLSESLIK